MLLPFLAVCGIILGLSQAGPQPIKDLPLEDPGTPEEVMLLLDKLNKNEQ
jgi:hypothetical protein